MTGGGRGGARRRRIAICVASAVAGCGAGAEDSAAPADGVAPMAERALAMAREYTDSYYGQFPELATEMGYPSAPSDRFTDFSEASMAAWRERQDAWLSQLSEIDPDSLRGTPAEVPYRYALHVLSSDIDRRACRTELWNVSPTWTGWPERFPAVLAAQPVATPEDRAAVMARVRDIPRYLNVEVENLRRGVREGYTAPVSNVDAVVRQVDGLLALPVAESPFLEPSVRGRDSEFARRLREVVRREVIPAIRQYRSFLAGEYRSAARVEPGVSALPDGLACYRESIRYHTTLPIEAESIHEQGLREMARIQDELRSIARSALDVESVSEALDAVRRPPHTFGSRQEILTYAQSAVDRAKAAVPEWFGTVPATAVVIQEYPTFQERTGGGFYSAGPPGQPGTYWIGTHDPAALSKAGLEATAFHEAYPGHHMQVSVVLEGGGVHPILKYFFNSGMGEGWALYTERLADEMGLYSSEIDRLGMLSNEALRAARLVVDPGMHVLGWSREQAIEYMLDHTAESRDAIEYEVDRYLAVPGQATSYLLGSLEIQRLRAEAESSLGERFDIREFHDLVLADGTVSLPMLRDKVERWMEDVR